jgi:hypothetical protein
MEKAFSSEISVHTYQTTLRHIPHTSKETIFLYVLLGTYLSRSKFYSERNYEQTEVRECFLSFGVESFVFQFAIRKFKD